MWFIHELHEVRGDREDELDASLRDEWIPAVAGLDGVRVLYVLRHAHGTGPSYNLLTITAARDGAAWERLAAAIDGGPLSEPSRRLDGMRHDVTGKIMIPLPWSPIQTVDLDTVPHLPAEHETSMFMADTVRPNAGRLEDYVKASGSHYAPEIAERSQSEGSMIAIEGAYRTAYGAGVRREILLWQRVVEPRALVPLITRELPERYRAPGTWMHDALELRDRWSSSLLRTVPWSPLY